MTTVNQIPDANITPSLPPKIREAVEKVKAAKAVWQEERRIQTEAAAMTETIRKRQEDTKTETQALNDEWRNLFRENQGNMTPRMKNCGQKSPWDAKHLMSSKICLKLTPQKKNSCPGKLRMLQTATSANITG